MLDIIEKQKKRRNKIKYTIHGFNQIEAIKLGLSTDDLAVLRWFVDFMSTNLMERSYVEKVNDMGFWVDYSTLIDALPILLADGNTYLQRFIELEKLVEDGNLKEYKAKKKKYHDTYRKKVQRIFAGALSQVLKKDDMKVLGNEKGSKIYIYIDRENYSKLLLNTNMETYLIDNGIKIENSKTITSNIKYKDGDFVGDKSVSPEGDKSVPPTWDKSVSPVGDKSVSPNSSLNNSSYNYSSPSNSYTQSNKDGDDISFYLSLKSEDKLRYLENKFDISYSHLMNILLVVDIGIEEGSITSKKGSEGYWRYIYKTCKSRQEKNQST